MEIPITAGANQGLPPAEVMKVVSNLTLSCLQDKARNEVSSGNIDKATKYMNYLDTRLLSNGASNLAQTVMLEAEHIRRHKCYSNGGDKRIKYNTRSLMLPSGLE